MEGLTQFVSQSFDVQKRAVAMAPTSRLSVAAADDNLKRSSLATNQTDDREHTTSPLAISEADDSHYPVISPHTVIAKRSQMTLSISDLIGHKESRKDDHESRKRDREEEDGKYDVTVSSAGSGTPMDLKSREFLSKAHDFYTGTTRTGTYTGTDRIFHHIFQAVYTAPPN